MSSSAEHPDEILTERSASSLLIRFNRPARKNALTSSMYDTVADLLNAAAGDEGVRVVLPDFSHAK
jgi:enoyl-CoA hydratase/carnithine racemase